MNIIVSSYDEIFHWINLSTFLKGGVFNYNPTCIELMQEPRKFSSSSCNQTSEAKEVTTYLPRHNSYILMDQMIHNISTNVTDSWEDTKVKLFCDSRLLLRQNHTILLHFWLISFMWNNNGQFAYCIYRHSWYRSSFHHLLPLNHQ